MATQKECCKQQECCTEGVMAQERFRKRMEAQCGQIERYKNEVEHTEGRRLSQNEAALEWIERYAQFFDRGLRLPEH